MGLGWLRIRFGQLQPTQNWVFTCFNLYLTSKGGATNKNQDLCSLLDSGDLTKKWNDVTGKSIGI